MFSAPRNRFGIPGVISLIALVFAMLGGAYAASDGGSDKTATVSAKKARKALKGAQGPRGPKGSTGATGPQGTPGSAGANGRAGIAGAAGKDGIKGPPGANGTSVTTSSFSDAKGGCEEGGVEVKSASPPAFVCNGPQGSGGGGGGGLPDTLPSGKTLTGTISHFGAPGVAAFIPISFPIPLAANLDESHVVYVPAFEANPDPTNCPGNMGEPKAASGYLCLYAFAFNANYLATTSPNLEEGGGPGAGKTGAIVRYGPKFIPPEPPSEEEPKPAGPMQVFGVWAVTG